MISEYIKEHDLDILAITETWLRTGDVDQPVIGDLCPPGYKCCHSSRDSGYGGVAVIHRSNLPLSQLPASQFQSIELLKTAIVTGSKRLSLYVVYRPLPSVKNGLSVAQFFDEFTDFMDNELLLAQSDFVLVGDFNFHMEENSDSNAKSF